MRAAELESKIAELSPGIIMDRVGTCVDYGVSCAFYFLNHSLGLKVYLDKRERDNNYILQDFLHRNYGVCPQVYNKIDISPNHFAFVTELCDVGSDILAAKNKFLEGMSWRIFDGICDKFSEEIVKVENLLPDEIVSVDIGSNNAGYSFRDSQLKIIDVGFFTVYDEKRNYYKPDCHSTEGLTNALKWIQCKYNLPHSPLSQGN